MVKDEENLNKPPYQLGQGALRQSSSRLSDETSIRRSCREREGGAKSLRARKALVLMRRVLFDQS